MLTKSKAKQRKAAGDPPARGQRKKAVNRDPLLRDTAYPEIELALIDPCPYQNRHQYAVDKMQELIQDVKLHGVIQPIMVRPKDDGRFERVVGERRCSAAIANELTTIPAVVRVLTDAEVVEIVFAENVHRQDLHPMDEAVGIANLLKFWKTSKNTKTEKQRKEIAHRLGKSVSFVNTRIKLLQLIDPVKDAFLADKISMQEALDIAALAADSQAGFYDAYLKRWHEQDFVLRDISRKLSYYHCDLSEAPFDVERKDLVPKMGACTKCPFNSAVMRSLFPELDEAPHCNNRTCYEKKSAAQFAHDWQACVGEITPTAIVSYDDLEEYQTQWLQTRYDDELSTFYPNEVDKTPRPVMPVQEDFTGNSMEEFSVAESEDLFMAALTAYENDLAAFETLAVDGQHQYCVFLDNGRMELMLYTEYSKQVAPPKQTAAQVQEAIRTNTVTPAMLATEITRIRIREAQEQMKDKQKLAEAIHKAFTAAVESSVALNPIEPSDLLFVRLQFYYTLRYHSRKKVEDQFFTRRSEGQTEGEWLHTNLCGLSDQQFAFMVRCCAMQNDDSIKPGSVAAIVVREMSESLGITTSAIETELTSLTLARQEKVNERIARLQMLAARLEKNEEVTEEEMEQATTGTPAPATDNTSGPESPFQDEAGREEDLSAGDMEGEAAENEPDEQQDDTAEN